MFHCKFIDNNIQGGKSMSTGIDAYYVLKCKPQEVLEGSKSSPHYQVHVVDDQGTNYRIAMNERSNISPYDLKYYIIDNFSNGQITSLLTALNFGLTTVEKAPGGLALDYVRESLFDTGAMTDVTQDSPDVLDNLLDPYIKDKACKQENCVMYAIGRYWDDSGKPDDEDQYFDFSPAQGMDCIHMNQGDAGKMEHGEEVPYPLNGIWQDGGLFIQYEDNTWAAFFFAFGSQSFNTDDNGNPV